MGIAQRDSAGEALSKCSQSHRTSVKLFKHSFWPQSATSQWDVARLVRRDLEGSDLVVRGRVRPETLLVKWKRFSILHPVNSWVGKVMAILNRPGNLGHS